MQADRPGQGPPFQEPRNHGPREGKIPRFAGFEIAGAATLDELGASLVDQGSADAAVLQVGVDADNQEIPERSGAAL